MIDSTPNSGPRKIRFKLNGQSVSATVMPHETIVDLLTNHFELTGTRESCGQGMCGCCTVHLDGKPISGCLSLAWFLEGSDIRTIEGVAEGDTLDPVQQAFIDASAFQCGFCTPGFILMTKSLLTQHPNPTDDQIRHYLTGNLCRCSAYPEIIEAVKLAASRAGA